jgi:hypothetical protein
MSTFNLTTHAGDFEASLSRGYKPSPVVKIDSMPVLDVFADISKRSGRFHDLDAGFNGLLPSRAKQSTGQPSADFLSIGTYLSLPDTSNLQLANGTILKFQNYAIPQVDFYAAGIETGDDLHQAAELQPGEPIKGRSLEKKQVLTPPSARCLLPHGSQKRPSDWPPPVDEHSDKYAAGYFLSGAYNDTAVFELSSFESLEEGIAGDDDCATADIVEFHRFMKSFVTRFRNSGKKRLVIDLSVNRGGWEAVLADAFDQLFPGKVPGFHYRVRATPALDWIGNATFTGREAKPLGFAYIDDLHRQWRDVFGPEQINGDNFTKLVFRDTLSERADAGINNTAFPDPLVRPENIVVVTDGDCHSSCALLIGWLTREMGIRAVAMGGRPAAAPMQAVGGTKGGGPYAWDMFQSLEAVGLNMTGGGSVGPAGYGLPPLTFRPIRIFNRDVNTMDVWHDKFNVPVHFAWEPAHCRLFYTASTLLDIEAMWKAVADVAWRGAKCVPGSTANADGTMGNSPPAFKEAVMPLLSANHNIDVRAAEDVRQLTPRPVSEWEKLRVPGVPHWENSALRYKKDSWDHGQF